MSTDTRTRMGNGQLPAEMVPYPGAVNGGRHTAAPAGRLAAMAETGDRGLREVGRVLEPVRLGVRLPFAVVVGATIVGAQAAGTGISKEVARTQSFVDRCRALGRGVVRRVASIDQGLSDFWTERAQQKATKKLTIADDLFATRRHYDAAGRADPSPLTGGMDRILAAGVGVLARRYQGRAAGHLSTWSDRARTSASRAATTDKHLGRRNDHIKRADARLSRVGL